VVFGTLAALAILDTFQPAKRQVSGALYVSGVRLYQWIGRPLLAGHVRCRYEPSCSEYSIGAVQKHGIRHGLVLTYQRVSSCTENIPLGTIDPVPPTDEEVELGNQSN
jgi:putative membrane protein insertion efficiency factor